MISARIDTAISAGTLGADGETDGRVDALQLVRRETGRHQSLQTLGMRAARAQRADVKARRAQGCRQRLVVDVRSVGEGDDRRARIEPELVERSFWPLRHGRAGAEALLAGKHRARVDDYDRISDLPRQLGEHLPDVRRASDDDAQRRHQRLREHLAVRRIDSCRSCQSPSSSQSRRAFRRSTHKGAARHHRCASSARQSGVRAVHQ